MEVGHKGEQNHGKGKSTRAMDGVSGTLFWFQKCLCRAQSLCLEFRLQSHLCQAAHHCVCTAGNVCWSCSEGWVKMCWSGFLSSLLPCLNSWWWQRLRWWHPLLLWPWRVYRFISLGLEGTLAYGSVRLCKWFFPKKFQIPFVEHGQINNAYIFSH